MDKLTRRSVCKWTLVTSLLPCLGMASPSGTNCDALKDATPQKLLSYLEQDRSTLDSKCITVAIENLGEQRYLPAIPTLIQYLDFKRPRPKNLPMEVTHPGPTNGVYPAATALERFQKFAIPDVKKAIQDDSLNRVQRRIAADLYGFWLLGDNPVKISFLREASKASKDAETTGDLLDIATKVAEYCPSQEQEQKQCYKALNGH